MRAESFDTGIFERKAIEVAGMLRALANERRLMILCKLVEWGGTRQIIEWARRLGLFLIPEEKEEPQELRDLHAILAEDRRQHWPRDRRPQRH